MPQPNAAPQVGTGEAFVRGVTDLPIVGPLGRKADAAIEATRQYLHSTDPNFSWGQTYTQQLAEQQARDRAAYAQHPVAAYGGMIGGSLIPGTAAVRAGGLGARLLGAVAPGTPLWRAALASGASGAGISAADAALRGGDPGQAAAIGGGIGAALPGVGAAISRPLAYMAAKRTAPPALQQMATQAAQHAATPTPFPPPPGLPPVPGTVQPAYGWPRGVTPPWAQAPGGPSLPITPTPVPPGQTFVDPQLRATQDFLNSSIRNQYGQLAQAATAIKPTTAVSAIDNLTNQLRLQNFDPAYQSAVFRPLARLRAQAAAGQGVSFQQVHALSNHFGAMRGPVHTTNQAAASYAREYLDDMLMNLHPQNDVVGGNVQANINMLRDVRADYLPKKNVDRIERAMQEAEAGGNIQVGNNLRVQARTLLRENARGKLPLDPGTVQILQQINARSRTIPRAISTIGMRHGLPVLAGGLGFGAVGPVGALAHLGAMHGAAELARKYEEGIITRLFDRAIQNELNRAPSVQRYNAAAPRMPRGVSGTLAGFPGTPMLQVPAQQLQPGGP